MNAAKPELGPLTGGKLLAAALCLGFANFMVVLDGTIANVSIPHIAGGLGVSATQGTWVVTSYNVAGAITVPLTGWLAQRFGAVKVFVVGMLGFGLFSFLCGLAPSFGSLVAFRVMQGLCGGPIIPTAQTLLLFIFPRNKAGHALTIWGMTTTVAPIAGPLLGGTISDTIGWSWIFFINIPLALGLAFGAWILLHNRDTATRRAPVDYVGLGLLVLWVGSLQIMLDRGKELEWFASPTIVVLAIMALLGFLSFLIWELTSPNPIVDLKVFRHRGFVFGVMATSLAFGAFFSTLVLIPLWLQTTLNYTATWAGYAAAFNGVLAVAVSPIVARLLGIVDRRAVVSFGIFWVAGVALWRASASTEVTFWMVALPYLVQGFAVPMFLVGGTSITMSSVLPRETASAAGLSSFLRNLSAAFATSLMGAVWSDMGARNRGDMVGRLNDAPGVISAMGAHGLTADQARGQIERLVEAQAITQATNQIFLIAAVVFVIAASLIWLTPKPKPLNGPPAAAH